MVMKDPLLTPGQAALLLGISPVTVRIWARKGKLPAHTTPGGHRRFDARELRDFARRNGMSLGGSLHDAMRILVLEDDRQFAAFVNEALKTLEPVPESDQAGRLGSFAAGNNNRKVLPAPGRELTRACPL